VAGPRTVAGGMAGELARQCPAAWQFMNSLTTRADVACFDNRA
jgi:hypothetical protein